MKTRKIAACLTALIMTVSCCAAVSADVVTAAAETATTVTEVSEPEAAETAVTDVSEPEAAETAVTEVSEPEAEETTATEVSEPEAEETSATEVSEHEAEETTATEVSEPETEETTVSEEENSSEGEDEDGEEQLLGTFNVDVKSLLNGQDIPSNDDLFAQYVDKVFDPNDLEIIENRKEFDYTLLNNTNAGTQALFKTVINGGLAIANGKTSSTIITAQNLNFNYDNINDFVRQVQNTFIIYLNNGYSYEFYWWDMFYSDSLIILPYGNSSTKVIKKIEFKFLVDEEYALKTSDGNDYYYYTDTAKTSAAVKSAANARAFVHQYASLDDYSKLKAYKDIICKLVDYNRDAVNDEDYAYKDAWNMIKVFDGNANTKVVCEGYSRAFQYLCENSTFKNNIKCHMARGFLGETTADNAHRWNIVSINGKNYLVDVTNCDVNKTGSAGSDDLFLVGATTYSSGAMITTSNTVFYYRDETLNIHPSSVYTLSTTDYPASGALGKSVLSGINGTLPNSGKNVNYLEWTRASGAVTYYLQRYNGSAWVNVYSGGNHYYYDFNISKGTNYTYRVIASSGKALGASSNTVSVGTAAPLFTGAAGNGVISLTWTKKPGTTITFVQRFNGKGWQNIYSGSASFYADRNVVNGKSYTYRIIPSDGKKLGTPSSLYTIQPTAAVKAVGTPQIMGNAAEGKATLQWTAVNGAKGYFLQKFNGKGWQNLKYLAGTTYTDTGLVKGRSYNYRVIASNGSVIGNPSGMVTVKY